MLQKSGTDPAGPRAGADKKPLDAAAVHADEALDMAAVLINENLGLRQRAPHRFKAAQPIFRGNEAVCLQICGKPDAAKLRTVSFFHFSDHAFFLSIGKDNTNGGGDSTANDNLLKKRARCGKIDGKS